MAASSSLAVLLAALPLLFLHPSSATDVVWYISPEGSRDIGVCGRSPDLPCSNLQVLLDQSDQFSNDSVTCYLSTGATDGRDSTTLFFLGTDNFVPPVCMMNWVNLRVVGLNGASITSNRTGSVRGLFEFINCVNVSIEDLNFVTSPIGRAVLFFEACRDVSVSGSRFPVTAKSSLGVQLLQCAGEIELSNDLFYGDPTIDPQRRHPLGVDVTHGCASCGMPFTDEPYDFANISFSLEVSGCVFRDLAHLNTPLDSYKSARNSAVALRIRFQEGSVGNEVVVRNSMFQDITNSEANGVLVTFSGSTEGHNVTFQDCVFRNNRVRYGGGVAAYFYSGPSGNALEVQGCQFANNTADLEGGGVFAVFLSSGLDNTLLVSDSNFMGGNAHSGSGIFLLNNPSWFFQRGAYDPAPSSPLVGAELRNCVFESNNATLGEGIVSALRMQLNITGKSVFTRSMGGSAVRLSLTKLTIQGEVTFSNNTAATGAALAILEGSKVDMSEVTAGYFLNNQALFTGGAIYADISSTTHLASEFNHTVAQKIFGGCYLLFGNEHRTVYANNPRRFTFSNNTAHSGGQHIHSYSLRNCLASNFVPAEIADPFLAIPTDGTILIETLPTADPLQSTSTGPSFLFFYGASTRCFKKVNGVTYLLPNCSRSLLNSTFYLHPDMGCGLLNLTGELNITYGIPGTGLRPTLDDLIGPWAGIASDWTTPPPPEGMRLQCSEPDPSNLVLSPAPGEEFDLNIQMAGQLLNFLFDTIFLDIEFEFFVDKPLVLVQFNGLQYGAGDRVYFTPNRPLTRMALVGPPGTEGRLRVVASSQVLGQYVALRIPFQLANCHKGYYLPSTLKDPAQVKDLIANKFRFTQRIPTDQPLACQCFSQGDNRTKFTRRVESLPSLCVFGYTVQLSGFLWAGFIPREGGKSAGAISEFLDTIPCPYVNGSDVTTPPISDSLTNVVRRYRAGSGNRTVSDLRLQDVIAYYGLVAPGGGAPVRCFEENISSVVAYQIDAVFSIELCGQGYCRGDVESSWYLANESFPCTENRMGPLCGQCVPGYAVTLYSSTCRNCTGSDKHYQYYLSLALTLVLGLALVLVVIPLNIGVTPTLDSLLFFIQAVFLLLEGREDYEDFKFLAFFNPNFTFDLCIIPNLDNLHKLVLQYVTPLYILLLMGMILLATCSKRFSRLLGKHSILQGLWLLFLISYFNIAMATFEILYCKWVGPLEMDGVTTGLRQYVLAHDPSVQCYHGPHLFYAIIALIIAIFFALPLPVYLLIMMKINKLKPISDVYCSCYQDRYRWWIFISLARRLLLVLVGVFTQDYVSRHFDLLVAVLFILLFTILTTPYRSAVDNYFTVFVTWMLLLTAAVTQPSIYLSADPKRGVSLFLVVLTIVCGTVLLVMEFVLHRLKKKRTVGEFLQNSIWSRVTRSRKILMDLSASLTRKSYQEHELEESTRSTASTFLPKKGVVDATNYREPLLDSQFYSAEEVDKFNTWGSGKVNSARVSSPYVSLSISNKDEEPLFSPKRFQEEEEGSRGGVAVTEVFTDRDTDSGVATSSTRYSQATS